MRGYIRVLTGSLLLCFLSNSYAINVNVRSTSNDVSALGFTVNGKNHGGMGTSYSAMNMPAGTYTFGVRVGGAVFGTDVPCNPVSGSKYVNLNKDTTATLVYDGKSCKLKIS